MPKIKNKILLPVCFEKESMIALDYANYFAKGTGAEIVLLHIIENEGYLMKFFSSEEQKKAIKDSADKLLDECVHKFDKELKVTKRIEYGKIYQQVEKVADEIHPNFILMGKTESPSIKKKIIGSNSLHVIKETKFPVVTISGSKFISDHDTTNKDIVLPLDIRKDTEKQIAAGIEYGKYFNSTVKIISILTTNSPAEEIKLLTLLNKAKKVIEDVGVKCTTEIIEKSETPIYQKICEYSVEQDAHLIVIMTQQENDITKYFIGHNALKIIENSVTPVLSIVPWESKNESVLNIFVDPLGIL